MRGSSRDDVDTAQRAQHRYLQDTAVARVLSWIPDGSGVFALHFSLLHVSRVNLAMSRIFGAQLVRGPWLVVPTYIFCKCVCIIPTSFVHQVFVCCPGRQGAGLPPFTSRRRAGCSSQMTATSIPASKRT